MIRLLVADPLALDGEGLACPVAGDLEGITPWAREAVVRAGAGVRARLAELGELPVGAAAVTPGGDLRVDFLIHVVLFSHEEAITEAGLVRAVRNVLRRATEWEMETLILPPLGGGAGALGIEASAVATLRTILGHLDRNASPREVVIPLREGYEDEVYRSALESGPGRGAAT